MELDMDIGHLGSGAYRTAMASKGGNQASPTGPREPSPTKEEILVIPEIRLPRTDSIPAPMAPNHGNQALPRLKSVFDYKKVAIILSIYLGAGTVCFYLVRHQISGKKTNNILDALYFTIVSMTSVGYGDLSPDSTLPILLVCLFSSLGMLLIGLVLSKAADLLVEKQEQLLEKTLGTATLQEQMESNKLRNKCIILVVLLVVLMAVGTTFLVYIEDLDLIHAFYCINATITSVGSDKCFSTKGGRVFALFWMLIGTIYVGQTLFTFTELYTQRRQRSLRNWVLKKKITISDLLEADIDNDGVLKISEYVLHKLKEMRKISQEDIASILKEFGRLDFNDTEPPEPSLTTDEILVIPEIRLPHTDSIPADMASIDGNQASPAGQPEPFSRKDHIPSFGPYIPLLQNSFSMWKVSIIFYIYLGAGTVCFHLLRDQISGKKTNSILDALYFTIILTTSVGYGDLSPDTTLAILLAALFAFLGTILIGIVLSKAADFLVEQQELLQEIVLNNPQMVADVKIQIQKQMGSNKMRNMCILLVLFLVIHIAVGTAVLVSVEDLDFIHAFYCIIATITSVGSDKCFSTKGGRVFALFWIMNGIVFLGQVLFTLTGLHTQRRQRSIQNWILKRETTPADLQAADLDKDGVVVAAEYILHKLKEMGKISREDMAPIIEEFRRLDINNKGELTQRDIMS